MARSTSLPAIASGEGGLNRYLQEIRQFPMLAPEEEFMLAKRPAMPGGRPPPCRTVLAEVCRYACRSISGSLQVQ